jgi:hypothetical protein
VPFHPPAYGRRPPQLPDPGRLGADVGDARPALTLTAVRERLEVDLLQPFKLSASGLVRDAFVLHGALVADRGATDDESDLRIPPQVVDLAARGGGVEEDLEVVGDDDADDGRLGALAADTEACTASGCSRMRMRSSAVVTKDLPTLLDQIGRIGGGSYPPITSESSSAK